MIFKEGELRLLWPFYLVFLAYGLSAMIFPFMIIYFLGLGLSFFQIGVMTAMWAFAGFLAEMPTGAFADRHGRKKSLLLGFLIVAFSVVLIPFTDSFAALLVLWSLAGIGMAFGSGAEEAWVIDNLESHGRADLDQEYYIKSSSITALGAVLAPLIGALIVQSYDIGLLWFVFGAGYLVSFIVLALFAKEDYVLERSESSHTSFSQIWEGLSYALSHRPVLLLIVAGALVQLTITAGNAEQPLLIGLGMAEHQLGYLYAIISFTVVFTPYLARVFSTPRRALLIITPLLALVPIPLLFIGYPDFVLAAVLLVIGSALYSVYLPVHFTYLQRATPKRVRARVLSASSMLVQLSFGVMTIAAGWLMDVFELRVVMVAFGLFGFAAWFVYRMVPEVSGQAKVPADS